MKKIIMREMFSVWQPHIGWVKDRVELVSPLHQLLRLEPQDLRAMNDAFTEMMPNGLIIAIASRIPYTYRVTPINPVSNDD